MTENQDIARRDFIKGACAAGAALALAGAHHSAQAAHHEQAIKVGGFTKEFQSLSYEATADAVVEIGWDGIECPVRPGGHVLPERVEEDLPKMVEALKSRGKEILVMATNIKNTEQEHTEAVARTGAKLGIKYYRIGYWGYDLDEPIQPQLDEIAKQLKGLEELNREAGICGIFQNHSGHTVGTTVWDIYEMVKDLDPQYLGVDYDIGHATVEGGYAWDVHFRRIESHLRGVVVKDFNWVRESPDERPEAQWCPIGEGMIERRFCTMLKASGFSGPACMHHEYHVDSPDEETRIRNLVKAMKQDNDTLRSWLAD